MVHRNASAIHHIDTATSDPIVDPSAPPSIVCDKDKLTPPTSTIINGDSLPTAGNETPQSPLPPSLPKPQPPTDPHTQSPSAKSNDSPPLKPSTSTPANSTTAPPPANPVPDVLTPRKITRSRLSLDARPLSMVVTPSPPSSTEKPRLTQQQHSPTAKPSDKRRQSTCSRSNDDLRIGTTTTKDGAKQPQSDVKHNKHQRPFALPKTQSDSKSVPCSPVSQRRTQSAMGLGAGHSKAVRSRKCVKNLSFSQQISSSDTLNHLSPSLVPKSSGVYCSVSLDRIPGIVESLLQMRKRLDASTDRSQSVSTPSLTGCVTLSMDKTLCLYCDRSFGSPKLYAKHSERVHQAPEGRRLSSRNSNSMPSQTFPGCLYCSGVKSSGLQSEELPALFKHLCDAHFDRYFACVFCSVRFINAETLREHTDQFHSCATTSKSSKIAVKRQKKTEAKSSSPDNADESILAVKVEDDEETLVEPALRSSRRQKAMLAAQKPSSTALRKKQMLRNQDTLLSRLGITQNRTTRTRRGCIKPTVTTRGETAIRSETPNIRARKNQRMASSLNAGDGTNADASTVSITTGGSSFGGRIIFDENFYEMVNANVRQNLSCHLDGKLDGAMSPSPSGPVQAVPSVRSTLVRSPMVADNEIHEATAISALTAFPTLLTAQQYGAEPMPSGKMKKPITKNSWKWKWDCVRKYKYVSEGGKFVKKIKQPTAGLRDLSKLDMWTQLTMRSKHETLVQQELMSTGQEGNIAVGEAVRQEKRRLITQLDDILDTRILPKINLEQNDQRIVKLEGSLDDELCSNPSTPSTPVKQSTTSDPSSPLDLPSPDDLPSCLMLQRKDPVAEKNLKPVILSGEWARPRCYICFGCGARFENMKMLDDHKLSRHPHVQSTHYEVVGKELMDGNLFRHFFIPSNALLKHRELNSRRLGLPVDAKESIVEDSMDSHGSFSTTSGSKSDSFDTDSNSRISKASSSSTLRNSTPTSSGMASMVSSSDLLRKICTKCKKVCGGSLDLYRHMLECSGDYAWMLAKKRQNIRHRYFGARRRRAQRTNRRERTAGPKPERIRMRGPRPSRPRPSDAESIQRMLADLPAKRTCHQTLTSSSNKPSHSNVSKQQKLVNARKFVSAKNTNIVCSGRKQIMIKQSAGGIATRRFVATASTTAASIAKNMQMRKQQKQQQHQKVQKSMTASIDENEIIIRNTRSAPLKERAIVETVVDTEPLKKPTTRKSSLILKALRRKTQRVVSKIADKLLNKKSVHVVAEIEKETVNKDTIQPNEKTDDTIEKEGAEKRNTIENTAAGTKKAAEKKQSEKNESEKKESKKEQGFFRKMSFRKSKRQVKESVEAENATPKPGENSKHNSKINEVPATKNKDIHSPILEVKQKTPQDSQAVVLAEKQRPGISTTPQAFYNDLQVENPSVTQSLTVITVTSPEPSNTPAFIPTLYSPLQPILVSPSPSTASVPQTPSPGVKRRPRKLNDCIAMLTGKLTERLGVPFLDTEPSSTPKTSAPMVLNVPSIPTVQAFLHQNDVPKPPVTRTTLAIPTLTIPTYHAPTIEPIRPEPDEPMTPVDLSIPKGTVRNDLSSLSVEIPTTPSKRRTPRKRNQRSLSVGSFQELIIPSPNKHIPVTKPAAPFRDTISEVIFAVSQGEFSEEPTPPQHVTESIPVATPAVPCLPLPSLPLNQLRACDTDMIPVFRIPTVLDVSQVPDEPSTVSFETPPPVGLETTTSFVRETSAQVVLGTPNHVLLGAPPSVETPATPASNAAALVVFETLRKLFVDAPTQNILETNIPRTPPPQKMPSPPTGWFSIKLKPMSELLAPAPVTNTRSRRSAKKKLPVLPDIDLLNCSASDTSLVVSDPCPGDDFNELPPELMYPEPFSAVPILTNDMIPNIISEPTVALPEVPVVSIEFQPILPEVINIQEAPSLPVVSPALVMQPIPILEMQPIPIPEIQPTIETPTSKTTRTTRNRGTPIPIELTDLIVQPVESGSASKKTSTKPTKKAPLKPNKSGNKDTVAPTQIESPVATEEPSSPHPSTRLRSSPLRTESDFANPAPNTRLRSSPLGTELGNTINDSNKKRKPSKKGRPAVESTLPKQVISDTLGDQANTDNYMSDLVSNADDFSAATESGTSTTKENVEPAVIANEETVSKENDGPVSKETFISMKTPQLLIVDCMRGAAKPIQTEDSLDDTLRERGKNQKKPNKNKSNPKELVDIISNDMTKETAVQTDQTTAMDTAADDFVNYPVALTTIGKKKGRKYQKKSKSFVATDPAATVFEAEAVSVQTKNVSSIESTCHINSSYVVGLDTLESVSEENSETNTPAKTNNVVADGVFWPRTTNETTELPVAEEPSESFEETRNDTLTSTGPNITSAKSKVCKSSTPSEVPANDETSPVVVDTRKSKGSSSKQSKKTSSKSKISNVFDSGDEEFLPWDPEIGFLDKSLPESTNENTSCSNFNQTMETTIPIRVTTPLPDTIPTSPTTRSPVVPSKPRKRRKNELAQIIADQLLESFKQVDQSRIGELRMLHDISIDSSTDDTLLRTTMSYTPPPKRKSATKTADEIQQSMDQKESESDASTIASTGKKKGKSTAKNIKSILTPEDKGGKTDKKKRVGIRFNLDDDNAGHQSDTEVVQPKPARIRTRRQTFCADRAPEIVFEKPTRRSKKKNSAPIDLDAKFNDIRDTPIGNELSAKVDRFKHKSSNINHSFDAKVNSSETSSNISEDMFNKSHQVSTNIKEKDMQAIEENPLELPNILKNSSEEKQTNSDQTTAMTPAKVSRRSRTSRLSIDIDFTSRAKRVHKNKASQDAKIKPKKSMVNDIAQIINDFTTSTIDSRNNSPVVFADANIPRPNPKTSTSSVNGFDSLIQPKPQNRTLELLRKSDKLAIMKSPLRAPFMSPRWEADDDTIPEPIPSWHTLPPITAVENVVSESGLLKSIKNKTQKLLGISKKKSRKIALFSKASLGIHEIVKRPLLRPSILNGSLKQTEKTSIIENLPILESSSLFVGKDTAFENEPNIFAVIDRSPTISRPQIGPHSFDAVKASAVMVKGSEVKTVKPTESAPTVCSSFDTVQSSRKESSDAKPRKMESIKTRPNQSSTPVQETQPSVIFNLNTAFPSESLPSIHASPSPSLLPIAPPQLSAVDQELLHFDCSQDTILSEIVNKIQNDPAESDEDLCLSEMAKNLNSKLLTTDEFNNDEITPPPESPVIFKAPTKDIGPQSKCGGVVNDHFTEPPTPDEEVRPTNDLECLDMDENTNTDLIDMDLEDTMSVYTSFSIDTISTPGGKRRKRRQRKSLMSKSSRKAKRAEEQFLSPSTFHCPICEKSFSSQSGLTSHKSTLRHISKLSEQEFLQSKESVQSETTATFEADTEPSIIEIPAINAELPCGSETLSRPSPSVAVRPSTPELPRIASLPSAKAPTPLSSPVRIPPPPTSNTYRPSGIEPISSPEQVDHASDRYNINSRLSLPMIGSPRQVLSQEERLFYECCSMLKGSERRVSDSPPPYYQLPRIHSSEMIMANNKPVTPRSNEQYSYVVPEGSKGKGTPKIDLNQFSDISSDSNPAYSCPQVPSSSETQHIFARQPKPPGIFTSNYAPNAYPTNTSAAMENLSSTAKNYIESNIVDAVPNASKHPQIGDSFESSQDAIENVEHFGQSGPNKVSMTDGRPGTEKPLTFERILDRDNQKSGSSLTMSQDNLTNHYSTRSPFESPLHSASSQSSTVSKPRTKAAMKGYENFRVSIPTIGIDMQQALNRSPNPNGCKLAALADIALGNDVPHAVGLIPSVNSDVESSKTGFQDKHIVLDDHPGPLPLPAIPTDQSEAAKKKVKSHTKASAIGNKLGFNHRKKKTGHRKKASSNKSPSVERPTMSNQHSKDVFDFDDSRDSFDKSCTSVAVPLAAPLHVPIDHAEDSQVSSYSDRDDFNYENSPSESDTSEAASCVTKRSVKSINNIQKKCLIMGRIFKGVKKVEATKEPAISVVEKVKEIKKPIPKQELDKMFDSLRASNETVGKGATDKIPEPLPDVVPSVFSGDTNSNGDDDTPKRKGKSKHKPKSVKVADTQKTKKAEGRQRSRKSKEIASIEAECGMSMDKICDLMGVGQRKTQRRCTTNKQKTFAETWSSDEYEEFHTTSDLIALIQQAEHKACKAAKVAKKAAAMTSSSSSTETLAVKKVSSELSSKTAVDKKKPQSSVTFVAEKSKPKPCLVATPKPKKASVVGVHRSDDFDYNGGGSDVERQLAEAPRAKIKDRRRTIAFKEDDRPSKKSKKKPIEITSHERIPKATLTHHDATPTAKPKPPPKPIARRKRNASSQLYYWSSSSDEEFGRIKPRETSNEDNLEQHGWIVGHSHKKLVTLLAHTKSKKIEDCGVKEAAHKKK